MTVTELLTKLENARSLVDNLRSVQQELIDAATPPMPAEVLAQLADIEAEFGPQIEAASAAVSVEMATVGWQIFAPMMIRED